MREHGKKYNWHYVEGNSFGTVKVTANAREELHQQFKFNGGDVYVVLKPHKDGYTFSFEKKSPSIRHRVIEVYRHSKPWMITCTEEIFELIKYKTLDIKMSYDGWILFPLKWR